VARSDGWPAPRSRPAGTMSRPSRHARDCAPRPPGSGYQELLATIAAGQILGGPAYDALIAFTAVEHQATLLSLDQRATSTYEAVGATVERLVP
jgi:hypothetical protein